MRPLCLRLPAGRFSRALRRTGSGQWRLFVRQRCRSPEPCANRWPVPGNLFRSADYLIYLDVLLADRDRPAQVNGRCRPLASDPEPQLHNFNNSPVHIIGVRTPLPSSGSTRTGFPTSATSPRTVKLEYYDYTTPGVSGHFGSRDRHQGPETDQKFESGFLHQRVCLRASIFAMVGLPAPSVSSMKP